MRKLQENALFLSGCLFYGCLLTFSSHTPFFWDTILTSTIANWFFENGWGDGIVPLIWDAGHPPFFQYYLSMGWILFGKTLPVSHAMMFPFLVLMTYFFIELSKVFLAKVRIRLVALALLLLHPYVLTQSSMVSYDVIQIAFFLMGVFALVKERSVLLAIAILGLSVCSIRGQLMGLGLIISGFVLYFRVWKMLLPAVLVWILFMVSWHGYHYLQTGWMLTTPSETWSQQRDLGGLKVVLGNVIAVVRGFVDYGTFVLSLCAVSAFLIVFKLKKITLLYKKLLFSTLIPLALLLLVMLPFSNPIGHRYWMSFQVIFILIAVHGWSYVKDRFFVFAIVAISFVSGHIWLYPEPMSNGWDVTLAHLPYHQNRSKVLADLEKNKFDFDKVATAFPLFCSLQQTDLLDGKRLLDIQEVELGTVDVVLFSPICNDMKDLNFKQLQQEFVLKESIGEAFTRIDVYQRKQNIEP